MMSDEGGLRRIGNWETRKRLRFRPFKNLQKYKTVPYKIAYSHYLCVMMVVYEENISRRQIAGIVDIGH